MFVKSLTGLGMMLCCIMLTAQVPEVELVSSTFNDPFMPSRYYRAKTIDNPTHQLRSEKRLDSDFKGQFISLVRSKDRMLYHPIFAQFGNIEIFIDKEIIHYGVPVQFDHQEKLQKFLSNIITPRTDSYQVIYFRNGRKVKASRTFF